MLLLLLLCFFGLDFRGNQRVFTCVVFDSSRHNHPILHFEGLSVVPPGVPDSQLINGKPYRLSLVQIRFGEVSDRTD
jgi:hypothetical protein